jgi:hypothetical protein
MRIIRVFPRRTRATPTDELAYVGAYNLFAEADEVHISVAFTWDLPEAERLEKEWRRVAKVMIGGPATGEKGGDFEPGIYVKKGYVITSRGCPNNCWFCSVPRQDGYIRELPIRDGWNVLDDNLLACSEGHIRSVFAMLNRQPQKAEFTGGLEAARLRAWHVDLLRDLNPSQFFFAYDTADDWEPLVMADRLLMEGGFFKTNHKRRAYVLIGYNGDTFDAAEQRLQDTMNLGFLPMAMLYRNKTDETDREWRRFQRQWARPAMIVGREG